MYVCCAVVMIVITGGRGVARILAARRLRKAVTAVLHSIIYAAKALIYLITAGYFARRHASIHQQHIQQAVHYHSTEVLHDRRGQRHYDATPEQHEFEQSNDHHQHHNETQQHQHQQQQPMTANGQHAKHTVDQPD